MTPAQVYTGYNLDSDKLRPDFGFIFSYLMNSFFGFSVGHHLWMPTFPVRLGGKKGTGCPRKVKKKVKVKKKSGWTNYGHANSL